MRSDWYLRSVLTVIAVALVYVCIILTPFPTAFAQSARTPGASTGPAEVLIVGWKLPPDAMLPVQIPGRLTVAGDVKVVNDVRVSGRVQTEQAPRTASRVVVIGWEENGAMNTPGTFSGLQPTVGRALPVTTTSRP